MRLKEPLFILGSPRSGTSMLRLILTCHPEVTIPPECGFILWLEDRYGRWNAAACEDRGLRTGFLADLQGARKFNTWNLSPTAVDAEIASSRPQSYAELCGVVVRAYSRKIGKNASIWGDKNNYYMRQVPKLLELYPNGRFLHLVRDVRDIACSNRAVMKRQFASPFKPNLPTDIEAIATTWTEDVGQLISAFEGIPDRRKITIRYEDLVTDPDTTLGSVCKWLSVPYLPEIREFYQENRRRQLEPDATLEWKEKTLLPIDRASLNRHLDMLSKAEAEYLSRHVSCWLRQFGYDCSP